MSNVVKVLRDDLAGPLMTSLTTSYDLFPTVVLISAVWDRAGSSKGQNPCE